MKNKIKTLMFWLLFRNSFRKQIASKYSKPFAKETVRLAKKDYFNIIEKSDIGSKNPKIIDILFTAIVISLYKAGKPNIEPEKMGKIMTDAMESVSLFRKTVTNSNHFCKEWQDQRNAQSLQSLNRKYADDFVSEFVYGKTYNEYGINYFECAIYKLLKREGCPELTYLFCQFDYVMANYMHANLERTKTLVDGGDCCNFRYIKKES